MLKYWKTTKTKNYAQFSWMPGSLLNEVIVSVGQVTL